MATPQRQNSRTPNTQGADGASQLPPEDRNRDGTPKFYNPDNQSPFQQAKNSSAGATGGAGVVEEKDQIDLVGQQIQIDKLKCLIKGRVPCGGELLYALESDKPMLGYDGLCPKCRRNHVVFIKPNQGFYASVKTIHDNIFNER